MRELKIDEAHMDRLDEVLAFVDGVLEKMDCPMKTQMQIDVAVEEVYVNIVHYAYAPGTGSAEIRVETQPDRVVAITFIDWGIYDEHLERYPLELSGGELQRMALARAMLMRPDVLILDEPTSMLDVISQAQVIHMLRDIQKKHAMGYLFISHDRALCKFFCDEILAIEDGVVAAIPPE